MSNCPRPSAVPPERLPIMLETEIRQVFSQQAAEQPPPARISLPAARAAARKRRAWRRAGVLGAPLLAAAAVISIAVASVIPGGGFGLGQGPVASPVAPKYFNPLRPYAAIGWLPAGLEASRRTHEPDGSGHLPPWRPPRPKYTSPLTPLAAVISGGRL